MRTARAGIQKHDITDTGAQDDTHCCWNKAVESAQTPGHVKKMMPSNELAWVTPILVWQPIKDTVMWEVVMAKVM